MRPFGVRKLTIVMMLCALLGVACATGGCGVAPTPETPTPLSRESPSVSPPTMAPATLLATKTPLPAPTMPVGTPSAQATAVASGLIAFQQEILYDQRGEEINAILFNRCLVVINPGSAPVKASITQELSPEEARNLDLEMHFGVMADILPAGVVLPPSERIHELPAPAQESLGGRGTLLRWAETTIDPGHALVAYYNANFQDPATLIQGDTVVLPLARVRATGGLTGDELLLEYQVQNTSGVPIEDLKLVVFLPIKMMSEGGQDFIPLYSVIRSDFDPKPSDIIEQTMAMDGHLAMAEGNLVQFAVPRLGLNEDKTLTLRATIQRTGNHGEVMPYVSLMYHALTEPTKRFTLEITSPAGMPVTFMPTLQISNLGWPDLLRILF